MLDTYYVDINSFGCVTVKNPLSMTPVKYGKLIPPAPNGARHRSRLLRLDRLRR